MKHVIHTIQSSELRSGFADALKLVKKTKKPLVIQKRNIPSAVLVDIDEYEDYLNSVDPGFLASIAKARKEARKNVFSMNDAFGNL